MKGPRAPLYLQGAVHTVGDAHCGFAEWIHPYRLLILQGFLASCRWRTCLLFSQFCLVWRNDAQDGSREPMWRTGIESINATIRYYRDRPRTIMRPVTSALLLFPPFVECREKLLIQNQNQNWLAEKEERRHSSINRSDCLVIWILPTVSVFLHRVFWSFVSGLLFWRWKLLMRSRVPEK